jgi:hypothetical protein
VFDTGMPCLRVVKYAGSFLESFKRMTMKRVLTRSPPVPNLRRSGLDVPLLAANG